MTYNVFGGTLNLAQSLKSQSFFIFDTQAAERRPVRSTTGARS